jgi:hypothetical protein
MNNNKNSSDLGNPESSKEIIILSNKDKKIHPIKHKVYPKMKKKN